MLAAVAIAGVDHGNRGNLGGTLGAPFFIVANDDDVAIARNDADGILELLAFNLRGEDTGLLGRKHTAAQTMHGRFEGKAGARGGRVEHSRHDAVLVVERASVRYHAFEATGVGKDTHE